MNFKRRHDSVEASILKLAKDWKLYLYKENLVEKIIVIIKSHLMELDKVISIWNEVQ